MGGAMAVYKGLNRTQETDLLAPKNTAIYNFLLCHPTFT